MDEVMSHAESYRQEEQVVMKAERRSGIAREKALALLSKYSEDPEQGNKSMPGNPFDDGEERQTNDVQDERQASLSTINLDDQRTHVESEPITELKTKMPSSEEYQKLKGRILPLSPQSKSKSKRLNGSYEFKLDDENGLTIVKSKDERSMKSSRSLQSNRSKRSKSSDGKKEQLPPRHSTPKRSSSRGSFFSRFSSNRSQRSGSGSWRVGSFEESNADSNAATNEALAHNQRGKVDRNKPPLLPPSNRSEFESNRGMGSTISDGDRDEIISVISCISEITDATPERTKQGLTVITSTDRTTPRIPDTLLLKVNRKAEKKRRGLLNRFRGNKQ
jgi:hypothetical protein